MVWNRESWIHMDARKPREAERILVRELDIPREEVEVPHEHDHLAHTHKKPKTLGSLWITEPEHEHEPLLPASHGSIDNPPPQLSPVRKAGYLAGGLFVGGIATALWSFDILAHLTALPFDDVIFHGAAAIATVAAVPLLNGVWRGYGPTLKEIGASTWETTKKVGRGVQGAVLGAARIVEGTNRVSESETHGHSHGPKREEYDGNGYPVSATTYAEEDINGRYGSGPIKRGVSYVVRYVLGPLGHSARGIRDEAAERGERVWSRSNPQGFVHKVWRTITEVCIGGLWHGAKRGEESYNKDIADGKKYRGG